MVIRGQTGSIIPWIGGKFYSAETIVSAFPEPSSYNAYVELFCGACHVLIHKPPYNHIEVINDLNNDLVNFWMHCRDNAEALEAHCRSLPYSREVYYNYHYSLFDGTELEPVERAVRWFYVLRSNFNGYLRPSPCGWNTGVRSKDRRKWGCEAQTYRNSLDLFSHMKKRFEHVMIENRDFEIVFKQWDKPRTLFYLDPPYVDFESYYDQGKQGFSLQDHERLAQLLNNSSAYIALSYYPHPVVDKLYPAEKWRRVTWDTYKHKRYTRRCYRAALTQLSTTTPHTLGPGGTSIMIYTLRAGGTNRTCDSLLGKQALLPLSYTCIHNYIQHTTPTKCENTGFYGMTRKVVEPYRKYAILTLDFEGRRGRYDCNGRYVANARRSSHHTQSQTKNSQTVYLFRSTRGNSGRWGLPCNSRGFRQLHSQEQNQAVKNKASSRGWPGTTKKFLVAIRSTLKRSGKLTRDGPRNSLPVFSIAKIANPCQWLHKTDSDRRESVLCTIFSPVALFPVYVGSEDGHARYYYKSAQ